MTNDLTKSRSIPIYLLEDEQNQLDSIVVLVQRLARENQARINIMYAGASSAALLEKFKAQHSQTGIFLLDIELDNDSNKGIATAEHVRQISSLAEIVFITARPDKSVAILQHNIVPRALIEKTELSNREYDHLNEVFQDAIAAIENQPEHPERQITIEQSGNHLSLAVSSIDYIETVKGHNGMLHLVTSHSIYSFRSRIKDVQASFPELTQAGQGYLVNLRNVRSFDHKTSLLTFQDDFEIYVARRFISAIKNALTAFAQRNSAQ